MLVEQMVTARVRRRALAEGPVHPADADDSSSAITGAGGPRPCQQLYKEIKA
jgi:hypothetical protein